MMGIRVIKTALAVTASVYLAWLLGLQFFLSAGIFAILSVEVTRQKNIRNAVQRLLASLLALAFAAILFESLGFHLWVLGLFVALAFPLLAAIHLKDGIITGTVIVTHLFEVQNLTYATFTNELLLLIIGIGSATLINLLYMPPLDRQLMRRKVDVEQLMGEMFGRIGQYLREAQSDWDGAELLRAERAIDEGLRMAEQAVENDWFGGAHRYWFTYFKMREQQMDFVRQMLLLTSQISLTLPQGKKLADLFFLLRDDVKVRHYTGNTERRLIQLEEEFRAMALPETRVEFENRAAMFQLMFEMKRYVAVARAKKAVPK